VKIRSFQGGLDLLHGLGESLRREDLGEGERAFLQELLSEGVELTADASVEGAWHRSGSGLVSGVRFPHHSRNRGINLSQLP
jgi:hypothetical protein